MIDRILMNSSKFSGLNPYCNGCTSMIEGGEFYYLTPPGVSILIVMDVLQ